MVLTIAWNTILLVVSGVDMEIKVMHHLPISLKDYMLRREQTMLPLAALHLVQ